MRGWIVIILVSVLVAAGLYYWITNGVQPKANAIIGKVFERVTVLRLEAKEKSKPTVKKPAVTLPKGTKLIFRGATKKVRLVVGKSALPKRPTDVQRYFRKRGVHVRLVLAASFFDPKTLRSIGHMRINGKEYNVDQCPSRAYVAWDKKSGVFPACDRRQLDAYRKKENPKEIEFFQGVNLLNGNYKTLRDAERVTKRVWITWPTPNEVEVFYAPQARASELSEASKQRGDVAAIMPDCGSSIKMSPCLALLIEQ